MLGILSNMILVTSILVILAAHPSPIINNILLQGTYILVVIIYTVILVTSVLVMMDA